jgi:hypothetical protein
MYLHIILIYFVLFNTTSQGIIPHKNLEETDGGMEKAI